MIPFSYLVRRILPVSGALFVCLLLMSVFASSSAFAATRPQGPHYKFKLVTGSAATGQTPQAKFKTPTRSGLLAKGLAPQDFNGPCLFIADHTDIPWDFNPGEYQLYISFGTNCIGQTLQGASGIVDVTSNCGGRDTDVGQFTIKPIPAFSNGLHLAYYAGRAAACIIYGLYYPPFTEHLTITAYAYNASTNREEVAQKTVTLTFLA